VIGALLETPPVWQELLCKLAMFQSPRDRGASRDALTMRRGPYPAAGGLVSIPS